jgi:E3 ubiquitin-protein ligase HECTD1
VEVNFMDDVGQTLLNWASAFGTQEMVEFLCAKGKLSVGDQSHKHN